MIGCRRAENRGRRQVLDLSRLSLIGQATRDRGHEHGRTPDEPAVSLETTAAESRRRGSGE